MSLHRLRPALLSLLMLAGCATATQKRADAAYARGDYVSAAALYDDAVREKPSREKLVEKRLVARQKALAELADHVVAFRASKNERAALAAARALVETQARWFGGRDAAQLSAAQAKQVEELAAWAVTTVGAHVNTELVAQKPLAARAALEASRSLFELAGFDARANELASTTQRAGGDRCAELKGKLSPESVHLTFWVAAYCKVFASEAPQVPAAPEQVALLKIEGDSLSPTTPAQRERLEKRLEELLLASPWFHAQAAAMASAKISGSHTATFSASAVKRVAHWIEQVPYQVQESYQESYTETEHYMASESYTTYRSESYSCGYGTTTRTCTRSVPNTQQRMVSKTRPVTKYRTKYRTVTRHRPEPRIFNYEATEHRGNYAAAWDVTLSFAGSVDALLLPLRGETQASADAHEVTFVPANIRPSRPLLMSHDQWFDNRLQLLSAHVPERLQNHWFASFCSSAPASADEAARCAQGARAQTPEAAKAALDAFLRDDATSLLALR